MGLSTGIVSVYFCISSIHFGAKRQSPHHSPVMPLFNALTVPFPLPYSRHARVCIDDFHWGIPALPGPAADRQIYSALVWRRTGRLDYLHVVFPNVAVGGLRLCAFHLT